MIAPKQAWRIPPGTPHYIANESDSDLEFLVISQPDTGADRMEAE